MANVRICFGYELDSYKDYVMDKFIKTMGTGGFSLSYIITDIPLVKQRDYLPARRWKQFQVAKKLQRELDFWSSHRVIAPWDSRETDRKAEISS